VEPALKSATGDGVTGSVPALPAGAVAPVTGGTDVFKAAAAPNAVADAVAESVNVSPYHPSVAVEGAQYKLAEHSIVLERGEDASPGMGVNDPTPDLFKELRGFLDESAQTLSSDLSVVRIHEGKIWFGLKVYDGEGYYGLGGVGFFDPRSGRTGMLRHPAMVDKTVASIRFEGNTLVLELEEAGWEMVDVDPADMELKREVLRFDPGDRDPRAGEAPSMPAWWARERQSILDLGLEEAMLRRDAAERSGRDAAFAGAEIELDKTCRISTDSRECTFELNEGSVKLEAWEIRATRGGDGCPPNSMGAIVAQVHIGAMGGDFLTLATEEAKDRRHYSETTTPKGQSRWVVDAGQRRAQIHRLGTQTIPAECDPSRSPQPRLREADFRVQVLRIPLSRKSRA
jgi:hypothetical protein